MEFESIMNLYGTNIGTLNRFTQCVLEYTHDGEPVKDQLELRHIPNCLYTAEVMSWDVFIYIDYNCVTKIGYKFILDYNLTEDEEDY